MKMIVELNGVKVYYDETEETPWTIENIELMKEGKDEDEENSIELSDKQFKTLTRMIGLLELTSSDLVALKNQ